jgi:hypothetical protein
MDKDARAYLRMRAEREMELANSAADQRAARAHLELAGLYLGQLEQMISEAPRQHAAA